MRAFFVVAAISAAKVHADTLKENGVGQEDNQLIFATQPIYQEAYVGHSDDHYSHDTHTVSHHGDHTGHHESAHIAAPHHEQV